MQFRNAGKTYDAPEVATVAKEDRTYYPNLDIDLDKFPELSKDIGEEVEFVIRGVVTRKSLSEDSKCQCVDIRAIGVSGADAKSEKPKNDADLALDTLKSVGRAY